MEINEEQNQPIDISPKRFKIEETLEGEEEDRISALPDSLILHILSLLPSTKEAIQTGILSKRWESLWTLIPTLIFEHSTYNHSTSDFVSIVNKTLIQCRHSKLKKFEIVMDNDIRFEAQVNSWIRYAVSCNVEELHLSVSNFTRANDFLLDDEFFINPCFTELKLKGFMSNPTVAVNWKMLKKLCNSYTYLDEDLIENIQSGCPVLETLVLESCYGYRRLDITSKSVKNLVLSGYDIPIDDFDLADIIEINAPYIVSLEILYDLLLWKILLPNVSSLVEAKLDYIHCGHRKTTRKEAEDEMFKGFIQSLRHVKELKVGPFCAKVVSRLEATGFVFPSNMKFPVDIPPFYYEPDCFDEEDEEDYSDSDSVENEDWEELLVDHGSNGGEVY